MNKTVVFVTFAGVAAVGIVGTVVILLFRPDATATFTNGLMVILAMVITSAGTFAAIENVNKKVEKVERQTNGNLHRRDTEVERLTNLLIERGVAPNKEKKEIEQY